jgi:hypothetical protein
MEIFLGLAALVAILYYGYLKFFVKPAETEAQIDKPVEPAPTPEPVKVAPVVTAPLDVNKDGKVDLADAKEVVKQTVARVKSSTPGSRKRK